MKKTKKAYKEYLNAIGVPEDDKKSNGGRVPDYARYGNWLQKNDPISFQMGFQEWE